MHLSAVLETTSLGLCKQEQKLLAFFLKYPLQLFSKAEILRRVWGYTSSLIKTNTLEAHVYSIRKKLASVDCPKIKTVPRHGYILE